jgi:hypothetical protein
LSICIMAQVACRCLLRATSEQERGLVRLAADPE